MNFLLSLIIPVYNCAPYLDETLRSVLNKMPENVELIVCDDGSDEETRRILKSYENEAGNLKILYRDHKGASAARNAGIDAASGKYIAFMDCDDRLKNGFLTNCVELLATDADLYIFGFDRVEADGTVSELTVEDVVYADASEFADAYIINRHLLVYSACNKCYRKEMLDRASIRFCDGLAFGEDRLFNYSVLKVCGQVRSYTLKMFDYMQRNDDSQSKKSFPNYYDTIMRLHEAKTECFLSLARQTTLEERADFIGYDLSTEVKRMIDRFAEHPEEEKENLPKINHLLFGETDDISGHFDYVIVLGSRDCAYRAARAFDVAGADEEAIFVVSGGNMHKDGKQTEAAFMADYLSEKGVSDRRIIVEDSADNTFQNLELSAGLIQKRLGGKQQIRIGIVTAGFHINRTRMWKDKIPWFEDKQTVFIPAYGKHTRFDNWYIDLYGQKIGLSEIAKVAAAVYSAKHQEA